MNSSKSKFDIEEFFKLFPDEDSARKQFEQWRWGDIVRCPHCDSVRISVLASQSMRYRCKDCRKRFSVRINTVMANSKFSFHTWMLATYISTFSIEGTSPTKLASDIGPTQKSAWQLCHRIREAWQSEG